MPNFPIHFSHPAPAGYYPKFGGRLAAISFRKWAAWDFDGSPTRVTQDYRSYKPQPPPIRGPYVNRAVYAEIFRLAEFPIFGPGVFEVLAPSISTAITVFFVFSVLEL